MTCTLCQAPSRELWAIEGYPTLTPIYNGNWVSLEKCPQCSALWCSIPHEPYGSFVFIAAWHYDETTFKQLNFIDNASIIHEWQDAVIREKWKALPALEQELVESWRIRTYRSYNPIDAGPNSNYPHPKYIYCTDDIKRFAGEPIK